MKHEEIRKNLINGTIYVIARDGINKATTKQIGQTTSINEAYIYRVFENKEDMFAKTFSYLDEELVTNVMQHVSVMYDQQIKFEMRCWLFFSSVWEFLLGNREKCFAFIRYYYSPYFSKYSSEEHKKRYLPLVDQFKNAFRDEANVWMILNHILTTMLDFTVKIFDGEVPNNNDTAEHVFRLIYCSVCQYFRT